jgi:hypothetical protein
MLLSSINLAPISYKDMEKAKKGMSKAQRDAFDNQLKQNELSHKQNLKHRAEMQKVDMRNAKLMGAARAGDKGLLSAFRGGIGKAGLAAALAAIIYAGFQMLSAPQSAPSFQGHEVPMARHQRPDDVGRPDRAPSQPPSNKRSRSISKNINKELKNILGD